MSRWLRSALWGLALWALSALWSGSSGVLLAFDGAAMENLGRFSGSSGLLAPLEGEGTWYEGIHGAASHGVRSPRELSRAELNKLKKVLNKDKDKDKKLPPKKK
ncbi:MAG: hypothetical protein N2315_06790 [Thermanaerothrix sp.]|nr:hypothetical protein [Thermanaerothrix sp.]